MWADDAWVAFVALAVIAGIGVPCGLIADTMLVLRDEEDRKADAQERAAEDFYGLNRGELLFEDRHDPPR